jgi:hypothetical protein
MRVIQSIWFDQMYWTKKQAFKWIHKHEVDYFRVTVKQGHYCFDVFELDHTRSVISSNHGGGITYVINVSRDEN